jgi:hypothetical protein
LDEKYITNRLIGLNGNENYQYSTEKQLSLFDDFGLK